MTLHFWIGAGLAVLAVAVLAACTRTWQDRGGGSPAVGRTPTAMPETTTSTPVPSPAPTATATPALAARVNGQPILLTDLERQVMHLQAELGTQGDTLAATSPDEAHEEITRQALDLLIDSALVEQAAVELGVVPSASEIETQVRADLLAGGGPRAFSDWLTATGLTAEDYSAAVRSSLLLQRVALVVTAGVTSDSRQEEAALKERAFGEWLAERRAAADIDRSTGP